MSGENDGELFTVYVELFQKQGDPDPILGSVEF